MNTKTFSVLGLLTALIVLPSVPAEAGGPRGWEDNELRFRIGVFEPRGDSEYWDDKRFDFTANPSDFEDAILGVDFIRHVGDHWSVIGSLTGYESTVGSVYRDFVDARGRDIGQDTSLESTNLSLGLLFNFNRRGGVFRPYLGLGLESAFWRLEERGDFIDFADDDLPIFSDTFVDDGAGFGHYFQAGLDVRMADTVSLFVDGRWSRIDDELGGDFGGLGNLDLGGSTATVGISWRF